jgi:hypothetical protein
MRAPLQSIRKVDDNDLYKACARVHAGLAAICCVLIAICVTIQFTDVLARSV